MFKVLYQNKIETVVAINDSKGTFQLRRTWTEPEEVLQTECEAVIDAGKLAAKEINADLIGYDESKGGWYIEEVKQ